MQNLGLLCTVLNFWYYIAKEQNTTTNGDGFVVSRQQTASEKLENYYIKI